MWSLRMRASKKENSKEKHISGAEGIYEFFQIEKTLKEFIKRAFLHSRGMPDKVVITIEKIEDEIRKVSALPITTHFSDSPEEAYIFIREKLIALGISEKALDTAFEVINNHPMRGATVIDSLTGNRLEKDRERGIRVSRLCMEKHKKAKILRQIRNISSEPLRTVEALTIASKVLSFPSIVAELCISDNPDYTTGYIASRDFGYLRITNIKHKGQNIGGRAFFIRKPCEFEELIYYLERKPVLVV